MNAFEFAQEFINDLEDMSINWETNNFVFNKQTYIDDPDLKILKSELNKINLDLVLINKSEKIWKLTKI